MPFDKPFSKSKYKALGNLKVDSILAAAERALGQKPETAEAAALFAANEMPHGTTDLDRGMAAGFAVAMFLGRAR